MLGAVASRKASGIVRAISIFFINYEETEIYLESRGPDTNGTPGNSRRTE